MSTHTDDTAAYYAGDYDADQAAEDAAARAAPTRVLSSHETIIEGDTVNGSALLTDVERIRAFVVAGDARFTLRSARTGTRFTYRVQAPRTDGRTDHDANVRFVKVLNGSDNDADYVYLGNIFDGVRYFIGRKSPLGNDAPSARAFSWFWARLLDTTTPLPADLEFFHAGCCARCSRTLTTPESIEIGLGPVCAGKV